MSNIYDAVTYRVVTEVWYAAHQGKPRHEIDPVVHRILLDAFDKTVEQSVQDILKAVRQDEQDMRYGHISEEELHGEGYETKAEEAIRIFTDAIREIQELQQHTCKFNEDDWCVYCGLDGRA